MNTDLLTFFQPEESSGTAATFSVDVDNEIAIEVWMFSREKIDLSRFAKTAVSSEEDWKNVHQELQTSLQPGGGFLVCAQAHNDGVKAQIFRKEAPGYQPPQRMLRLTLCGDAHFEEIKNNADLRVGDHLVLPVNGQAEGRLTALRDDLKGLPSDLESSVLNIIRRPSLEWRLDRIERTLSLPQATQADQRKSQARQSSFMERLYDFVMWKVPIGPVVGALVLMTGALFAYTKYSKPSEGQESSTNVAQTEPQTTTASVSTSASKPPADTSQRAREGAGEDESAKSERALSDLRQAMGKSKDPAISELYESHFKDSAQPWKSGNPTPAFWGMAKLQALQLNIVAKNEDMLKDPNTQTKVKLVYRKKASIEALTANKNALDLLGWLACQGSDQPAFPKTDKDPNPSPLPTQRKCSELKKPDSAVPGLQTLTAWVNKQGGAIELRRH